MATRFRRRLRQPSARRRLVFGARQMKPAEDKSLPQADTQGAVRPFDTPPANQAGRGA
jgi:hypothetical protein